MLRLHLAFSVRREDLLSKYVALFPSFTSGIAGKFPSLQNANVPVFLQQRLLLEIKRNPSYSRKLNILFAWMM